MAWEQLMDDGSAARAREIVDAIAATLRARPLAEDERACGLMSGDVGVAVFLGYHARVCGDAASEDRVAEILAHAIDRLGEISDHPELYAGFAGTAWAVEHLGRMFGLDDDLNAGIDEALSELLASPPSTLSWEWLSGITGLGVYALERLPRAAPLLEQVVMHLDKLGERTGGLLRWRCPDWKPLARQRERFASGCYPVDPAHGACGPLGLLAFTAAAGIAVPAARELATATARWLFSYASHGGDHVFPVIAGEPATTLGGWCQGDPGVAVVLSAAGSVLGISEWITYADKAVRSTAARVHHPAWDHEGGLCHGLAGIGHILNRVAQRSNDDFLRTSAREALRRVLGLGLPDDPDMLVGTAGIGLVLLAATSAVEPEWDRALLMSSRVR